MAGAGVPWLGSRRDHASRQGTRAAGELHDQGNGRRMSGTRKSADRAGEGGLGGETAVRFSISVAVDLERAFRVFTEQMSSWWPPEHHINDAPMAAAILEPRVGGRWYELGTDGSECEWGMV